MRRFFCEPSLLPPRNTLTIAFLVVAFYSASPIASAQTLNTLFTFNNKDGLSPVSTLVEGKDGNFYGTTPGGGEHGAGTVFKMTPDGQLTTLYNFCSQVSYCMDGTSPFTALIQNTAGNFIGTTLAGGGPSYRGTVFEITPNGLLKTLHIFGAGEGSGPRGQLVRGSDGSVYGTTWQGGLNAGCFDGDFVGCGTAFKITPDGVFTTLYYFCSQSNCTDGANPVGGLVLGTDGNLYGTTYTGGGSSGCVGGCGTVFKITLSGALTTLYSFCSQSNCPDGQFPNAALVQGTDGSFYGTTSEGGLSGTVFKISPDGQLTTLYNFCSQLNCEDGSLVNAGLLQAKDGNFYGITTYGGVHAAGTVFKISPGGVFTNLYSFCSRGVPPWCTDGQRPYGGLIQASNGRFYGTTQGRLESGCTTTCGTIFSFATGLDLQPSFGTVGRKITIVGLNLRGATEVTFHGTPSSFTPISQTQIAAIVPAGATTGRVRVTTPGGILISNSNFIITSTNKSATSTSLTSSLNPSTYGQKVTFTAQVTTSGPVPPTGTVVFTWRYFTQTYTIGSATLNSAGVATLTKSDLNADQYPMIAVYRGDTNNPSSMSAVLNQTVLQTTSAAGLTSSVNPSTVGQAITFTAKITSPTVVPSGPVTFKAGTTVLGTSQLSSGKAIFTTSTLPAGSTVVKVIYNGNSNIKGSSASVTQTVQF